MQYIQILYNSKKSGKTKQNDSILNSSTLENKKKSVSGTYLLILLV